MKGLIKKLISWIAYLAAGCIILLAIAVGLFRLFLPRLPAHQEDIKGWATAAIGMEVDFSGMNARWRFSGPELNFYNTELTVPGAEAVAFAADEVSVGVDLMRLVFDRTFVVDSVLIRDTSIDLARNEAGDWVIQGFSLDALNERFASGESGGDMLIVGEDVNVSFRNPADNKLLQFTIDNLRLNNASERLLIDVLLELPESLGKRLNVGIVARPTSESSERVWQYNVEARDLNLAGWSALQPADWPTVVAGTADLSMSLEQQGAVVRNAAVELEATRIATSKSPTALGIKGRVDYRRDATGWLLAAEDVRLATVRGNWPSSNFTVQGETDSADALSNVSVEASYLQLEDLYELQDWLPARVVEYLDRFKPTGSVANVALSLTDIESGEPGYDMALELLDAGWIADERLPGVRGVSGTFRADLSGGRVEMDSTGLSLDLSRWLAEPLALDSAIGTLIWRRNQDGVILLSDDIALQNEDFASHSNVQLSLPADGGAPVLDLESRWSVIDINSARRYLPEAVMSPALYDWLQNALLGGSIPSGTTRFSGAVDRFPFDDGDGVFLIEATLADATLRYGERWPTVDNLNLDLIVDKTRLYSEKNTASNAGNSVENAKIEIADLRQPVLTISALSTGTLETIRRFARQSPIADVFGGRLDEVTVAGEASFVLELNYPIRNRDAYDFTTRIQLNEGTLSFAGFAAPVSELNGLVTISRNDISADALSGRFLGELVNIDLRSADAAAAGSSVIADVNGFATVQGLANNFGMTLDGIVDGGANYVAEIRFPRSDAAVPTPFNIAISSNMEGFAVQLPAPLTKPQDERKPLTANIIFPADGVIEAAGNLGDDLAWSLTFLKQNASWDFDRGVLAVGGANPETAETRGLHVTGDLPELRLSDWLDLNPAGGGPRRGMASRIRSLDINVQSLHVLGQHFGAHHVVLDRGGNEWLVTIEGAEAQGSLSIPYDFASGRALTADMETLILPGSDEEATVAGSELDPRQLPPVSLQANEFAFGKRFLGSVAAEFQSSPNGLVTQQFNAEDKTFTLAGSAGWIIASEEPAGQKTWVQARLESSDVGATFARLDTEPGIVGDDMALDFDVSWPGGPREDFLDALDGTVAVRFGTGQLDEIEPGAGRMFGLMSVVALPRRLALDFRDVLDKGFLFDEITGTFRIIDGDAFTCDLSLKGPAADIGIVGRAGLYEKDYSQTAVVSANVGNTLPVVGAVVAGPQVAAALLIFSRIFKKPLQEMGQAYYSIEGSWDEPEVSSADSARFATISREADCLEVQP
ncbi:MAG: TIGR02099 family protein [Woeseia sp.]|nr:TIGR02099 family protein [Woeseia sp.]